jgi:hypothetical protein
MSITLQELLEIASGNLLKAAKLLASNFSLCTELPLDEDQVDKLSKSSLPPKVIASILAYLVLRQEKTDPELIIINSELLQLLRKFKSLANGLPSIMYRLLEDEIKLAQALLVAMYIYYDGKLRLKHSKFRLLWTLVKAKFLGPIPHLIALFDITTNSKNLVRGGLQI